MARRRGRARGGGESARSPRRQGCAPAVSRRRLTSMSKQRTLLAEIEAPRPSIEIAGRQVGGGAPAYLIAEVAQAHDGSLGLAHRFIDAAKEAGADAVKFQTHFADEEFHPRRGIPRQILQPGRDTLCLLESGWSSPRNSGQVLPVTRGRSASGSEPWLSPTGLWICWSVSIFPPGRLPPAS